MRTAIWLTGWTLIAISLAMGGAACGVAVVEFRHVARAAGQVTDQLTKF